MVRKREGKVELNHVECLLDNIVDLALVLHAKDPKIYYSRCTFVKVFLKSRISGKCHCSRALLWFQVSSFKIVMFFNGSKEKEFSPRMKSLCAFQEMRKPFQCFLRHKILLRLSNFQINLIKRIKHFMQITQIYGYKSNLNFCELFLVKIA